MLLYKRPKRHKRKEVKFLNKELLEYEMAKKGVTTKQICKLIGISRSAFYKKKTGKSEFKRCEIKQIMDVLDINNPKEIFFNN